MKKIRKFLIAVLIICLVFLMPTTAFAKSKKAKAALAAYKSMLSQSRINVVPYNTYFEDKPEGQVARDELQSSRGI